MRMHKQGVDLAQAQAVNAGTTENMMAAWRQGQGDYFHEQGPYPQQLEHEQVAHIVASVGEVLGPVAFSSLTATREWLQKPEARRFMRAYRKAREWVNTASAAEIARAEQGFFPDVDPECADADDRVLPAAGMLEPAGDDLTRDVRGGAGCVPALAAHHETAPV